MSSKFAYSVECEVSAAVGCWILWRILQDLRVVDLCQSHPSHGDILFQCLHFLFIRFSLDISCSWQPFLLTGLNFDISFSILCSWGPSWRLFSWQLWILTSHSLHFWLLTSLAFDTLAHKCFYMQKLLHTEVFTHQPSQETIRHGSFYTHTHTSIFVLIN